MSVYGCKIVDADRIEVMQTLEDLNCKCGGNILNVKWKYDTAYVYISDLKDNARVTEEDYKLATLVSQLFESYDPKWYDIKN